MIHVRLVSPVWSTDHSEVRFIPRAEFKIDGRHVVIEGDAHYIDLSLPIIEPESRRRLLFHDDPETWARNLPLAYRSGDVVAELVEAPVPAGV